MSTLRTVRLLTFGFAILTACDRGPTTAPKPPTATAPPTAPSPPPPPPKPEPPAAELRAAADAFLHDVIAGARHPAYLKMERQYRASSTEAQFNELLDGMARTFGKPLEAKYDATDVGTNLSLAGLRKFWAFRYIVRTDMKPKDTYEAKVTLTADPDPGVSGFTFTVFEAGNRR